MERKIRRKRIASLVILLIANVIFFLTIWLLSKYDEIKLDQVLFQIKTPAGGVDTGLANSALLRIGLYPVLLTTAEVYLYRFLSGIGWKKLLDSRTYQGYREGHLCAYFRDIVLKFSVWMLVLALGFFCVKLDVFSYLDTTTTDSDFIVEHYVDPSEVDITFPEEKRNLVYIFLESMETTYSDTSAGGSITHDFIPELTRLARENVSFSNTEGLGGALSYQGTTWTAASLVAQTSGVVVKVPLTADAYGGEEEFIPGLLSLGEILAAEGYNQTIIMGSDAEFAGRYTYFVDHGGYEVLDVYSLIEEGRLPEDYWEWWGFEDEKLFRFAREEILELAEKGEPFNLTLLTADTHFPDGYVCPLCGSDYEEQYSNVLACSSRQVWEFIQWLKAQPFYENTTIVIAGDHLTMDPVFLEDIDEDYVRTVYNCFINSAVRPYRKYNRQFGVFDMFPTTLAAMGVKIEGDRLGLGTNLFSGEVTWTERYGRDGLDTELQMRSEFYNEELLGMEDGEYDPVLERLK